MNKKVTGRGKKAIFGIRKEDRSTIYISKPTFDCGWYWSFGYLGNKNEHYHLDGIATGRNLCLHDALLKDYDLSPQIKNNLWTFTELVLTAYTLIKTASIYHIGGSHQTENPCGLKNDDLYHELVNVTLPKVLQEFWDLVEGRGNYKPE